MIEMADVRLLIQEEGRAARNLVAFNVPVASNNNVEKLTRKPPSIPKISQPTPNKRCAKPPTRVRSASTGRDKKSGKFYHILQYKEQFFFCIIDKIIINVKMKKQRKIKYFLRYRITSKILGIFIR